MTAINHALTGAVIGLLSGVAVVAVPLALISHFICDAIPHYGSGIENKVFFKSRQFKIMLLVDASLCTLLVIVLGVSQPQHWLLAAVCAFVAASPDFLSIGRFRKAQHDGDVANHHWLTRFAGAIQWFERPIGAVVEASWAVAAIVILVTVIH